MSVTDRDTAAEAVDVPSKEYIAMKRGFAVIVFLAGIVLAAAVAFFLAINGIEMIADGLKAEPTKAFQVLLGILMVAVVPFVATVVFWLFTMIAAFLGFKAGPSKWMQRRVNRMAGVPDNFGVNLGNVNPLGSTRRGTSYQRHSPSGTLRDDD